MSEITTPTHDTSVDDEVLTMEETCRFLKISRVTMYRLLKDDSTLQMHGRKVGRRWRFTKRGILEWLESDSDG